MPVIVSYGTKCYVTFTLLQEDGPSVLITDVQAFCHPCFLLIHFLCFELLNNGGVLSGSGALYLGRIWLYRVSEWFDFKSVTRGQHSVTLG